jgi:hypothetical protein
MPAVSKHEPLNPYAPTRHVGDPPGMPLGLDPGVVLSIHGAVTEEDLRAVLKDSDLRTGAMILALFATIIVAAIAIIIGAPIANLLVVVAAAASIDVGLYFYLRWMYDGRRAAREAVKHWPMLAAEVQGRVDEWGWTLRWEGYEMFLAWSPLLRCRVSDHGVTLTSADARGYPQLQPLPVPMKVFGDQRPEARELLRAVGQRLEKRRDFKRINVTPPLQLPLPVGDASDSIVYRGTAKTGSFAQSILWGLSVLMGMLAIYGYIWPRSEHTRLAEGYIPAVMFAAHLVFVFLMLGALNLFTSSRELLHGSVDPDGLRVSSSLATLRTRWDRIEGTFAGSKMIHLHPAPFGLKVIRADAFENPDQWTAAAQRIIGRGTAGDIPTAGESPRLPSPSQRVASAEGT